MIPGASARATHEQGACIYKGCSSSGYENDWAVPWYAACTGQGHNGKVCEARRTRV